MCIYVYVNIRSEYSSSFKHMLAKYSFREASYSGGGNITFKGKLEDNAIFTARLFQGDLLLGDLPLHFTYSVSYPFCALELLKMFKS